MFPVEPSESHYEKCADLSFRLDGSTIRLLTLKEWKFAEGERSQDNGVRSANLLTLVAAVAVIGHWGNLELGISGLLSA